MLKWFGRRIRWVLKKFPFLVMVGLIAGGFYLQFTFLVTPSPILGFFLFAASMFSVFVVFPLWRKFTPFFGPWVIDFATQSFIGRKLIAGGSFVYSEYEEDPEKIGLFSPISRFINLTIAFLGVSTTLIKMATQFRPDIKPESPVEEISATIGWIAILFIVPVILTPIIPVVWAMEDLRLKAWHKGKKVNWRVADKYRVKFNSFIAVGAVTAGLTLSQDPNLSFLDNAFLFLSLLGNGMILLTFPLSLLVAAYYLYFRGEITEKTLERLDIPTAMTELIFDVEEYKSMSKKLELYEKEEAKRLQREKRAQKMAARRSKITGFFRNPFSKNNSPEILSSEDDLGHDQFGELQDNERENEVIEEETENEHVGMEDSQSISETPATTVKKNEGNKVLSTLKAPPRAAKHLLGTLGSKGKSSLGKISKPFKRARKEEEN